MVDGVDVSKFQAGIDWTKVRAAERAFVFIRASDGANGSNETTFATKWVGARSAGLICGAYHLFRPSSDMGAVRAQADLFLRRFNEGVPSGEVGYLPPVIDVEISGIRISNADYVKGIQAWIDAIEPSDRFRGMKTIVYTRAGFWTQIGDPKSFADHPLWVADYSKDPPRVPTPWGSWTFFQHSDSGHVDGVSGNVDLDRFNGTLADLQALVRTE